MAPVSNREKILLKRNPSNFLEWRGELFKVFGESLTLDWRRMLKEKKLAVFKLPKKSEIHRLTSKVKTFVWMEKWKEAKTSKTTLKSEKQKVIAMILNSLSVESEQKIQIDQNYDTIIDTHDVIGLWELIEQTHAGSSDVMTKAQRQKEKLNFSLSQGELTFEAYCQAATAEMERLALIKVKISPSLAAFAFYTGLEKSTFAEAVAEWTCKDELKGTLSDAITHVSTWYSTQVDCGAIKSTANGKKRSLEVDDDESHTHGGVVAFAKKNQDEFDCILCDKNGHFTRDCRTFKYMKEEYQKKRAKKFHGKETKSAYYTTTPSTYYKVDPDRHYVVA